MAASSASCEGTRVCKGSSCAHRRGGVDASRSDARYQAPVEHLHAFGNARSARRLARCQEAVERQLYARSATLDRPPTQRVDVARAQKGEDWHLNKLSVTLCFTCCSCCKRAVLQRSACPHSVSACAVKPLARADVMSPLFALVDLSSPKTLQKRRAVEAEVSVRADRFFEANKFRTGFAAVELDLLPRGSGCLVLPRAETAYFISASRTL